MQVHNLGALWRIDKVRMTAYHHVGNGACYRLKQTIKHGLHRVLR